MPYLINKIINLSGLNSMLRKRLGNSNIVGESCRGLDGCHFMLVEF
jgi:hypothetical protein